MKKLLITALAAAVLLAGCVSAIKVETGERLVGTRLMFNLEGPWNQINAPGLGPAQVWTMEGVPVDRLLVYSGIKDGEEINSSLFVGAGAPGAPGSSGAQAGLKKSFKFRSSMQPDEIVALFEGMHTSDGSTFKLTRLEPAPFGGGKGFRFEYAYTRKSDNAQLQGLAYGVVDKNELFAILYNAPRLTFFPRHQARVDQMAKSARLR